MRTLAEIEKRAIIRRLVEMDCHAPSAAASLGIGRSTLYRKLRAWGLDASLNANRPLSAWKSSVRAFADRLFETDVPGRRKAA